MLTLLDDDGIGCFRGWCCASRCGPDTRKSWTGLSSRQELDSGMHRLELEPEKRQVGSHMDAVCERREQDPCGPSVLNCVWHVCMGWNTLLVELGSPVLPTPCAGKTLL